MVPARPFFIGSDGRVRQRLGLGLLDVQNTTAWPGGF